MTAILKRPFFLIIALGFLLYLPSLFGSFVWDDEDFVFANRYVQNFEIGNLLTHSLTSGRDKESNYFRPVQGIVYATTYQIVGANPFWFHLVNVLAHIGAACTIFAFFKLVIARSLLTKQSPSGINKINASVASASSGIGNMIPLIISLLFLIHPVQTEAVSYISGLSDPLFVLFGFLSLIFFQLRHERKNMLPLSLFFFVLSILSKETGLVFLPLLFLFNLLTLSERFSLKKFQILIPYTLFTTLYLVYHFTFINNFDIKASWGNTQYANSLTVRLLTFVQNLSTYVGLLIFPKDLFMERDFTIQIQTHLLNPYLISFFIINLAIISFVLFLHRKSRIHHSEFSILLFCYLGFFISFTPYTGLVLINGIFYEHFLYLPLVFFFAFWITLVASIEHRVLHKVPRFLAVFCLLTILTLLSLRNVSRQLDWIDPVRFYSQTLSHAPQSVRITNGLGIALSDKGELQKAVEVYDHGIKLSPETPNFYHNKANILVSEGKITEAERLFLKAIEVDPNFIFSWQSLATLYQRADQKEKLEELQKRFSER